MTFWARNRGFTLVEALFSAALIGVLAQMGSLRFTQYLADLSLRETANDFYRTVLHAQEKAVLDRRAVAIVIEPAAGTYRMAPEKGPASDPFDERTPDAAETDEPSGRVEKFGKDISASGPPGPIRCFPDGGCRAGLWRFQRPDGAAYDLRIGEGRPSPVELRKDGS